MAAEGECRKVLIAMDGSEFSDYCFECKFNIVLTMNLGLKPVKVKKSGVDLFQDTVYKCTSLLAHVSG